MPEQTNSVSSGLSPIIKTAGPGRADLTAGAKQATGKGTGFSDDLDKARQQQLDKVHSEPAQRNSRKNGNAVIATEVKPAQADAGIVRSSGSTEASRTPSESPATVTGELDVIGSPVVAIAVDESGNPLLPQNSQQLTAEAIQNDAGGNELPASLATSASLMTPTSATTEKTAPTIAAAITGETPTVPNTSSASPVLNPVTAQLRETQRTESTPAVANAVSNPQASVKDAVAPGGSVGEVAAKATLAGQASGLNAVVADDGVVTPPVLSTEEGLVGNTGRLSREQPVDVAVRKTPMEPAAVMTNAATLSKGRLSAAGEARGAVMTAPETVSTGQVDNISASRKSAADLTQLASGSGIVTPATLAGRFRYLGREVTAPSTRTAQSASQTGLTQAALPSLSVGGAERVTTGEMPAPPVNDSLSGLESLRGASEVTQTVQQRIAMTEAMLSQMAQEAGAVTVKESAGENLALGVSGNTVAAPMVQPGGPVAGPVVQAPLNINLASADAETALAGNVKWMTNEGVKSAVMTVTPHGMGPISVKIGIDGDQMDVSIIASQHSTRDALEAMLPRLREQLAVQGHETVKVDVSDGKNEQSRSGNGQTFAESRNPAGAPPRDNQSNGSNHGEKTDYGRSDGSDAVAESVMAEDLQRVAARALGEAGSRPVFDAYV